MMRFAAHDAKHGSQPSSHAGLGIGTTRLSVPMFSFCSHISNMSRKNLTLCCAAVALSSCQSAKPAPQKQTPERDHWTVVPAGQKTMGDTPFFSAWRLNKQTGELDFCTYDPGGDSPIRGESLDCSAPNTPTSGS